MNSASRAVIASYAGFTSGEWKAHGTGSTRTRIPSASKRRAASSTPVAVPAITVWRGALKFAQTTPSRPSRTAITEAASASTAAIMPGSEALLSRMNRPRSSDSWPRQVVGGQEIFQSLDLRADADPAMVAEQDRREDANLIDVEVGRDLMPAQRLEAVQIFLGTADRKLSN